MIPAATIARLRELESAARAGEWYADGGDVLAAWAQPRPVAVCEGSIPEGNHVNAEFIAELRNHAADLLDAAEELANAREIARLAEESEAGWRREADEMAEELARLRAAVEGLAAAWEQALQESPAADVGPDELRAILAAPTTRGDR